MKIKLLLVGLMLFIATSFEQQLSQATVRSTSTSNMNISFVPGTEATPPLNPDNPGSDSNNESLPANQEDNGTGNGAPVSFDFVSEIKVEMPKKASKTKTYGALTKQVVLQVTDNRGSTTGWLLSGKLSEFKNEAGDVLKGATLSLNSGNIRTTLNNPSAKPHEFDTSFGNNDPQVVMLAHEGEGRGTWLDVYTTKKEDKRNRYVQLEVLGNSSLGTGYQAIMDWQLADAPK